MTKKKETTCVQCSCVPCECRAESCDTTQSCPTKPCVLGKKSMFCVAKVLAVAVLIGWYHWSSHKLGRPHERTLEVNVDVEKEAKADFVIWRIGFQNSGADIKVLQEKFNKDRDLIVAFLKKKGFSDEEISLAGPRMTDQYAQQDSKKDSEKIPEGSRYIIGSRVKVITANVDSVTQAVKDVDSLVKDGVILVQNDREANPRYYLKNQTQLEQDLHAESGVKAKAIAEKMASTMNVQLGSVKSVNNWHPVEILGQGQSGRSGGYWDGYNDRLRGPDKIAHLQEKYTFYIK